MISDRPGIAAALATAAFLLAACGGAPASTTTSPSAAATTAAPVPSPSATTDATPTWTVAGTSKATVRVREQLVGVSAPSDAVLVASGGTGTFAVRDDGTFSPDSKITFDLMTLTSDQSNRDSFVKRDTLQTAQFPKAEFVPTKATALVRPIPTSGDFTFKVTGQMTIHGQTKEVTFDVSATRTGNDLAATATANPGWKFGDFGMTAPSVPFRVVSVIDEIRVVVDLRATAKP
jgi:polyisoprenoid-binding protein YceI